MAASDLMDRNEEIELVCHECLRGIECESYTIGAIGPCVCSVCGNSGLKYWTDARYVSRAAFLLAKGNREGNGQ